ncbi:MAG: hypothetical protein R3E53_15495 [Myxococcota bacterium]
MSRPLVCLGDRARAAHGVRNALCFYPNDHLEEVGVEASRRDIDECMALAEWVADLDRNQALEAGKRTAGGAAVKAHPARSPARSRGGPDSGRPSGGDGRGRRILLVALRRVGKRRSDAVRYVDTCLAERGYQSIGWK